MRGNSGDVIVNVRRSFFDRNGEYCNLIPIFVGGPCDDDSDRDVDDGFDIDEAGPGKLYARISNTDVTNNFDEGIDFDTEDPGGAEVVLSRVFALGNQDEGFKLSEEGSGDIEINLRRFTRVDNNGDSEGIEIEEENEGKVTVFANKVNMIGDLDEQLKIEQIDGGIGTVRVKNSVVVLDLDGVEEL